MLFSLLFQFTSNRGKKVGQKIPPWTPYPHPAARRPISPRWEHLDLLPCSYMFTWPCLQCSRWGYFGNYPSEGAERQCAGSHMHGTGLSLGEREQNQGWSLLSALPFPWGTWHRGCPPRAGMGFEPGATKPPPGPIQSPFPPEAKPLEVLWHHEVSQPH